MAWRGTVVAPVLMHWSSCSLALCHQCQYASCFICMLPCYHGHIDGLVWNCGSSSADALELLQSCAVSTVSVRKLLYAYVAMCMSMAWCRTVVAPVLMHWSCCSLALGHQYEHTGWPTRLLSMSILVSWCGTGVAPVLMHWSCCSLVLGHQCDCWSCSVHLLSSCHFYADGLAWNCGSSSADALGLLQSCAGLRESARVALCTCYHAVIFILMAWHGTAVAPVLAHWNCCSVALSHQDEFTIWTTRLLSWSYWCTAVVMVLRWAIGWSTQLIYMFVVLVQCSY